MSHIESMYREIATRCKRDCEECKALSDRIFKTLDCLQSAGKLSFQEADDLGCMIAEYATEYGLQQFETGFALGNAFAGDVDRALDSLKRRMKDE